MTGPIRTARRSSPLPLALAAALAATAWVVSAEAQDTDPDLIKLGQSLLPDEDGKPAKKPVAKPAAVKRVDAGAGPVDAGVVVDAGAVVAVEETVDAAVPIAEPVASAAPALEVVDAAAPPVVAAAPPPEPTAPKPSPLFAPAAMGKAARQARIDSGQNLPLEAAKESPLAAVGVPVQAVPVVATTATVGAMAIWPFLVKTLTGLAKSLFGAFVKNKAKQGQKIDKEQKAIAIGGFTLRPFELASLLLGALVYGLGVCYAFQGRKLSLSFLASQEALVVVIYYARSFVRFGYERFYKLPTQFRFWPGGGLLCLASAYLGNTLGTVGYELEETKSPEDAQRIVRMKAMLVALSLAMAFAFFAANVVWPMKILQSGRVMMSGIALAEILPIAPMPGKKIKDWNVRVWLLLVVITLPTFVLVNFVL